MVRVIYAGRVTQYWWPTARLLIDSCPLSLAKQSGTNQRIMRIHVRA